MNSGNLRATRESLLEKQGGEAGPVQSLAVRINIYLE
jgi:hypothetical protein